MARKAPKRKPATKARKGAPSLHVVYDSNVRRWWLKRNGRARIPGRITNQAQATAKGRRIAKREARELVIHERNGKIRDADSYGGESRRHKDKVH